MDVAVNAAIKELHLVATERTGLEDFGDSSYKEGLTALLEHAEPS